MPTHARLLRQRLQAHGVGAEDPVVDVGGGTGRYTSAIHGARRSVAPVVLDPSLPMLHKGRSKGRRHQRVAGSAHHLPLADRSVRAITVTEALHHFPPDVDPFLSEAARVLREDGVLIVEEPDPASLGARLFVVLERLGRLGSTFHAADRLADIARQHFAHVRTSRSGPFTYVLEAAHATRPVRPSPQS